MSVDVSLEPGSLGPAIDRRLARWHEERIARRMWARDPTIWADPPVDEIVDRLGWLDLPSRPARLDPDLTAFSEGVAHDGFSHAAVLGMGGSSLAPGVFQAVFGNRVDRPRLSVVDTTHPVAVATASASLPEGRTLFIVSSKSGTTLETLSLFRFFWSREHTSGSSPGHRFTAVTDPGSPLESLAARRGFRATFTAPPDVGGRYSALSEFGLVPAAVIGVDPAALGAGAADAAARCGPDVPAAESPALVLGAMLGEAALGGADKATLVGSGTLRPAVPWIEQLVAESTGKSGTGIVPVGGDDEAGPLPADRVVVSLRLRDEQDPPVVAAAGRPVARIVLDDERDLGGAMFVLEMAVAAAGAALGIHPFNQPDVQAAKDLARRAMEGSDSSAPIEAVSSGGEELAEELRTWIHDAAPPAYAGIHAYLPSTMATREAVETLRRLLRDAMGIAATADFGPRFLHSTGQLHKGGPAGGRFLQIVDEPETDIDVPETDFSFGRLIRAQADGDYRALRNRGRSVVRVSIGARGGDGLASLLEATRAATSRS